MSDTPTPLEPCPFCGLEPRYILEGPHGEQETHIFCVCPMEPIAIVDGANNLAAAAAIWNRRAPKPTPAEPMEEIAKRGKNAMDMAAAEAVYEEIDKRLERFTKAAMDHQKALDAFVAAGTSGRNPTPEYEATVAAGLVLRKIYRAMLTPEPGEETP